jgi:hypothetical protein
VSTASKAPSAREYRITGKSKWSGAWKIPAAVAVFGLGIAAYGYHSDPVRFAFSYLFAFWVALSLPLGCLFFVMVQYITKSSWSVTVRRSAELLMRPMPVFAVLAIPLVLSIGQLFPWLPGFVPHRSAQADTSAEAADPLAEARGEAAREPAALRDLPVANAKRMERAAEREEHEIMEHKSPFLNRKFFLVRLIGYLLIWTWLVQRYFRWSTDQDKTKALENTAAGQRFAPLGLILFGITITLFAFDWLLSLNGTWYSTIFGVQVFAQCTVFTMSSLIVLTLALRRSGLLGNAVNVEHYHDLGKFLFGWIVFWTYITFVQFFLIWYSNIPDEVAWYHLRWNENGGTYKNLGLSLVVMHFFVPFWFLMSRNVKRRLPLLATGATCMIVMHVLEVYWLVMPALGPLEPSLIDLGCLLGVFGVYLAIALRGMEDYSLVAVGDPRLHRALEFENA